MRKQALSLFAGVSFLALAGVAQADDAVVLGQDAMDAVTAAGTIVFNTDVAKTVDINKTVSVLVTKDVTTTVDLTGNLATAEASADAIDGTANLAETETFAQVTAGGAFAFSDSLAANN